jgi:hypothetical protein
MPSTRRPGWNYERTIVALLRRVGGYVSFPASEAEQGTPSYHMTVKDDGSLHIWLPGRGPEGKKGSPQPTQTDS